MWWVPPWGGHIYTYSYIHVVGPTFGRSYLYLQLYTCGRSLTLGGHIYTYNTCGRSHLGEVISIPTIHVVGPTLGRSYLYLQYMWWVPPWGGHIYTYSYIHVVGPTLGRSYLYLQYTCGRSLTLGGHIYTYNTCGGSHLGEVISIPTVIYMW